MPACRLSSDLYSLITNRRNRCWEWSQMFVM